MATCGFLYAVAWEPFLPGGIIVIEGAAEAFLGPGPVRRPGHRHADWDAPRRRRASMGRAGTVAFIASSLAAGWLFSIDERYPFVFFAFIVIAATVAFWLITRGVRLTAEPTATLEGAPT